MFSGPTSSSDQAHEARGDQTGVNAVHESLKRFQDTNNQSAEAVQGGLMGVVTPCCGAGAIGDAGQQAGDWGDRQIERNLDMDRQIDRQMDR